MQFLRTLLPGLLSATTLLPAAERPNIVFIMCDDLGYGDLYRVVTVNPCNEIRALSDVSLILLGPFYPFVVLIDCQSLVRGLSGHGMG